MKRILLPTDFSDNAFNAIQYALQLFKNEECICYLLNTFTPASYHADYLIETAGMFGLEDVALMNSKKEMANTEERIKKEFGNPKHSFVCISAFNTVVSEIIDTVAKFNIDLIIMGTKGATGTKEVFMGMHTLFTIKKTKCPVLAVPSGYSFESPKEILFPTDYNLSKNNRYLSLIKDISAHHVSRINILNAYFGVPLVEQQEEVKTFLDQYFKEHTHIFHIADGMDVLEAVEDFQEKHKINLLVMIHNKHSFFENLLFKPVINKIAHHTETPFLIIPSEKRIRAIG